MKKEPKLKALVIERDSVNQKWDIVNMTELTEDDVWHCGANIITNIEDVIERAEKENVPVITRKIMKNYFKKVDKNNQLKQKMLVAKILSKN